MGNEVDKGPKESGRNVYMQNHVVQLGKGEGEEDKYIPFGIQLLEHLLQFPDQWFSWQCLT